MTTTKQDNDRWVKLSYGLAWLALLTALLHVLASYGSGRLNREVIYNSDATFIPVFYRDVWTRGTLQGWDLPTNPYFFPDMALFIPLDLLVDNINLSIILYGIVQLLITCIGMLWLQRYIFGRSRLGQIFMLLMLTLCILFIATGEHIFELYALMSVHHFGVMVIMPFAIVAWLTALQPEQNQARPWRPLLMLIVLTLLTSCSDSLFTIQFVLPALITSCLWANFLWIKASQLPWRRIVMVNSALLLAAAIGQWVRQLIVPLDKLMIYAKGGDAQTVAQALTDFVHQFTEIAIYDPLLAAFWATSLLALISVLVLGGKRLRQSHQPGVWMPPLVATLLLTSMFLSIVAVAVSGNPFSTRYIFPVIFLPIFAGWPLLLATWLLPAQVAATPIQGQGRSAPRWHLMAAATSLLSLLLIVYTVRITQASAFATLVNYEDATVACLERETAQRNLHNGMAGYWQTTTINALSEGRLNLVTVQPNLAPYLWNANRAAYQPPFEFVIIRRDATPEWRIREDILLQRFGPPTETFSCESSEIFVYDPDTNARIRYWFTHHPAFADLKQVGDVANFFGYTLPSANGGVSIGLSQGVSEDWGNSDGALAYVPSQSYVAGSYIFAVDLYTESANTGTVEVVAKSSDDTVVLYTEPIEAVGKSTVRGHFSLPEQTDVEIRVKYNGHGTLFVDEMQIAHVDPAQITTFEFAPSLPAVASDQAQMSLLHPHANSFINHRNVDFAWQWTGAPLPPGETFEVRLWHAGQSTHFGAHDAAASQHAIRRIGDTYLLRLDVRGAHSVMQHGAGDYLWTVARVAVEPAYQDLQHEAAPFTLHIEP